MYDKYTFLIVKLIFLRYEYDKSNYFNNNNIRIVYILKTDPIDKSYCNHNINYMHCKIILFYTLDLKYERLKQFVLTKTIQISCKVIFLDVNFY